MEISRWHRNTSLLALSLSIDSVLQGESGLTPIKSEKARKRTVRGRRSRTKAVLGLAPATRRIGIVPA
jgi:hypothetical protein